MDHNLNVGSDGELGMDEGKKDGNLIHLIRSLFPRTCVKVTILIFGILGLVVVGLGFIGIPFSLLQAKDIVDLVRLVFSVIMLPFFFVGSVCFIASAVMKKKNQKVDRVISATSIVCCVILSVLQVLLIAIELVLYIVVALMVNQEMVDEIDPDGKSGLTVEDVRNMTILYAFLTTLIGCVCCMVCCAPGLFSSIINCLHTLPQENGDSQDEIPNIGVDHETVVEENPSVVFQASVLPDEEGMFVDSVPLLDNEIESTEDSNITFTGISSVNNIGNVEEN